MRIGRWISLWLLAVLVSAAAPARADQILLSQTGMVSGTQSFVTSLEIRSAGRLTVALSDMGWLARLSDLSFVLTRNSQVLSEQSGSVHGFQGSLVRDILLFDITGPGIYSAYVVGTATGPYQLGLYSMSLSLGVTDSPLPVPVPAAGLLLLSALSGLAIWRRPRRGFQRVNIACVA